MLNNQKAVIDTAYGNITFSTAPEKVVLYGVRPYADSTYTENAEIEVQTKSGRVLRQSIPDFGYNLQLFIADFTGDGFDDIMVRGQFGGSGGHGIARIYMYRGSSLAEIFNQDMLEQLNPCAARYINPGEVGIYCANAQLPYIFEESQNFINYDEIPLISPLNTASPIYPTDQKYADLLTMQRVIGLQTSDTIATIQTILSLYGGKPEIKTIGVLREFEG